MLTTTVITCAKCGNEFQVKACLRDTRKFCSLACKYGEKATPTCWQCHLPFQVRAYRRYTAKFCSRSCKAVYEFATGKHKTLHVTSKRPPNWNQIEKLCAACGEVFMISPSRVDSRLYCSKACYSKTMRSNMPARRYIYLSIDGKRVLEHRYVVEQALGRKLHATEHVHHKNRNRHDNRLENLEVLDAHAHFKLHARLRAERRLNATT